MPRVVPQILKSLNTIHMQPEKMSSRIELIMCLDLAGKSGVDISKLVGVNQTRVSIIRNSPLYLNKMKDKKRDFESKFMDKQTDIMTSGDPVEETLKSAALEAARKKIDLMANSGNEFVQAAAAGDILDRAGYKSHTEKTKTSIEITDKMADRFENALKFKVTHEVEE